MLRQESYSYDLIGNPASSTDRRGQVTSITYDPLNRAKFVGYNTVVNQGVTSYESTVSYAYDGGNRMTQVVDTAGGTITEAYDDLDRLTTETTAQGSISYGYDTAGRRTSMTVAGQPQVSYAYDNADRLTQITQGTSTVGFNYDNDNRRASLTLSNGVNVSYSYDNDSRVTGISYNFGANLLGNLTYAYDSLGRRTEVGGSFARTGMPSAIASATYDAANELANWNGMAISYDLNGNMLNDGSNTFSWNARNQVASLNGVALQYDAFGRRTKNLSNTTFLYDGANPAQELSGSAPAANLLSGGIDEFFRRADASGTFTPLTDALGSTIALVDSTGNIVTSYSYDPFGNTTVAGTVSSNEFQYTGRENEGNGLYFYRARYYSPALGSFTNEDPAQDGINFYAYADNDPIDLIDPFGLATAAPGFGESLIPIWGSGRQAVHDFQCGHWVWGTINAGLAVSDVFLIKSLFTAAGKVGIEGLAKLSGSHTWDATSKWLTKTGWRETAGQQFHHWLIPQKGWGAIVPDVIKNQPWNLMRMPEGIAGDILHDAIHGWGDEAMGLFDRLWHGSPIWAKVGLADAAGKGANLAGRACGCE